MVKESYGKHFYNEKGREYQYTDITDDKRDSLEVLYYWGEIVQFDIKLASWRLFFGKRCKAI